MYRKFDVTGNLILHSALFDDLNTALVVGEDEREFTT
jgi:hypothetical protein